MAVLCNISILLKKLVIEPQRLCIRRSFSDLRPNVRVSTLISLSRLILSKFWLFHRICRFGHSHFSENPSYPEFFAPFSERQQHACNWRDLCSTFWKNVFVINSSSSRASIFFACFHSSDSS